MKDILMCEQIESLNIQTTKQTQNDYEWMGDKKIYKQHLDQHHSKQNWELNQSFNAQAVHNYHNFNLSIISVLVSVTPFVFVCTYMCEWMCICLVQLLNCINKSLMPKLLIMIFEVYDFWSIWSLKYMCVYVYVCRCICVSLRQWVSVILVYTHTHTYIYYICEWWVFI